jgi:hypothetical protein
VTAEQIAVIEALRPSADCPGSFRVVPLTPPNASLTSPRNVL